MEKIEITPTENNNEEIPSIEEFEKRLNEKFTTSENGIEYSRVTPENLTTDRPVIYIGGFGQGVRTYSHELYDLFLSGRDVIFANPIHGVEGEKSLELESLKERHSLPDIITDKVAAIEEIITDIDTQKIDLVGHSQGGAVAAILSAAHPGLSASTALLCPAGFKEDESSARLIGGFGKDKVISKFREPEKAVPEDVQENLSAATKKAGLSFAKEIVGNPKDILWRFKEIGSIAGVDLLPILRDMKTSGDDNSDLKTLVTLVGGHNDGLFESEMYEEKLGENWYEYIDHWAEFNREGAGHTAPGTEQAGHMTEYAAQTSLLRQILNTEG
jgi:pimeloyl-ACP methyl ester carboxylesterase